MTTERNSLPGSPTNKLVREVRSVLWHYGIRPKKDEIWRNTWEWAHKIGSSYSRFLTDRRIKWPIPSEIASQYVFLLLVAMRDNRMLRLPFRAAREMPPSVQSRLTAIGGQLVIGSEVGSAG